MSVGIQEQTDIE